MKTKTILQTLGLAAALAVSSVALAHSDDRGHRHGFPDHYDRPAFDRGFDRIQIVNQRQDRQLERIFARREEGRLTRHEFHSLMDEQRDIRRMKRVFLTDGRLSRFEFEQLDQALDLASRRIFREAHDEQERPGLGYGYGRGGEPHRAWER